LTESRIKSTAFILGAIEISRVAQHIHVDEEHSTVFHGLIQPFPLGRINTHVASSCSRCMTVSSMLNVIFILKTMRQIWLYGTLNG